MKTDRKKLTIYNGRIAKELLEEYGFEIVGIDVNRTKKGYLVFHFIKTDELVRVLNEEFNLPIK